MPRNRVRPVLAYLLANGDVFLVAGLGAEDEEVIGPDDPRYAEARADAERRGRFMKCRPGPQPDDSFMLDCGYQQDWIEEYFAGVARELDEEAKRPK